MSASSLDAILPSKYYTPSFKPALQVRLRHMHQQNHLNWPDMMHGKSWDIFCARRGAVIMPDLLLQAHVVSHAKYKKCHWNETIIRDF